MCDTQVRIAIAGAGGRMGRQLIQSALQMERVILTATLEHKDSSLLGIDAGELVHIGKIGILIQSNLISIKDSFDVLIDFTDRESTLKNLMFCRQHNKMMVIGTTGFSEADKIIIKVASQEIAIVFAANFSIGMNIVFELLKKVAKVMGNYTDIEIIEAHHRYKVDAPSGTALAMGEVITQAMNKDLKTCAIYKRKGYVGKRVPGTIGFSTIRAGDIVGEHTVIFADIGERIEITHKASNQVIYANGAIRSALWLRSKKKGLFNMKDVLGLYEL